MSTKFDALCKLYEKVAGSSYSGDRSLAALTDALAEAYEAEEATE